MSDLLVKFAILSDILSAFGLVRNDIPYGNIKLLNQYGKQLELSHKQIADGKYRKKIKGFL